MNEKGSLKDRLKAWWIYLLKKRRKLEKEQKEKERLSLLFHFKKTVYILGSFCTGIFLSKQTKKEQKKDIILDEKLENIKEIRKVAEEEESLEKINNCKVNLEIEEMELSDYVQKMNYQEEQKNRKKIEKCEEGIESTKQIVSQKIENFENRLEENLIRKTIKPKKEIPKEQESISFPKKRKEEKKNETSITKKDIHNFPENITIEEKEVQTLVLPKKEAIIKGDKEQKEIISKEKIKEEKKQKEDFTIVQSKEEITIRTDIKKSVTESEERKLPKKKAVKKEMPVLPIILPVLTANFLRKKEIDKMEKLMEEKHKQQENPEIKKKEEVQKKQKKSKISKEELSDLIVMSRLIDENIKKNKEKIEKLKNEMKEIHPVVRKQNFLSKLHIFMLGTIKSVISLAPLKLFKNKTLGVLTSAVLVNNSIRSMRNTMRKEEYYIDYMAFENIHNKMTSTLTDMEKISYICNDSLTQIEVLKSELSNKYEMDENLDKVLQEIKILEEDVYLKLEEIEKTKENLELQRKNAKQKVLAKKYDNH